MSTLSRTSVTCLAVPHFFSRKRQDININVPRSSCNVSLFFHSEPNMRTDLSKIPNKVSRKSILWQQGYFLRGNRRTARHGEAICRVWLCSANASCLDHVIIDNAELCLLSTVVLLAEAMKTQKTPFPLFYVIPIFLFTFHKNKTPFHS